MSDLSRSRTESPVLVLVVGLMSIVVLQGIAIRSVTAAPLLGLGLGIAELVLAGGLTFTPPTRVLRWLLAFFGVATVLLAVFYLVEQPV